MQQNENLKDSWCSSLVLPRKKMYYYEGYMLHDIGLFINIDCRVYQMHVPC